MRQFSISIILILSISSCTTSYLYPPLPTGATQETMLVNGYEFLISHGEVSGIAMFLEKTKKNEFRLHTLVFNTSTDKYFDFRPEEIEISYNYHKKDYTKGIIPPDKYLKKLERNQNIQIWTAAFDEALNGSNSVYDTNNLGSQLASEYNYQQSALLFAHTLYPADELEGDVMVKPSTLLAPKYVVKVPCGSDIHYFTFDNPKK